MDEPQIVQRPGMAPLGGVAIKGHGAGLILSDAASFFIKLCKLIPRLGRAGFYCPHQLGRSGLRVIARIVRVALQGGKTKLGSGVPLPRQFGQALALRGVQIPPCLRGRIRAVRLCDESWRRGQPPKAPGGEAAAAAAAQRRAKSVQHGADFDIRLGQNLGQCGREKARVFTALVTGTHLTGGDDQRAKARLGRRQRRGRLARGRMAVIKKNKPYLSRLARRTQQRRQRHPLLPQRRGRGQGRIDRDQIALPARGDAATRVVDQGDIRRFGLKGKIREFPFERGAIRVDQRGNIEPLPL